MTARRHHYVPQFYLKGFCHDSKPPRLFVIDTRKRATFYAAPSNVAVELDFHTIHTPGQPSDTIETKLAQLESEIGPALGRIRERRSLDDENDRTLLLTFMALLLIKNPRMRDRVSAASSKAQLHLLKAQASDAKGFETLMERAKLEGTIKQDADVETLRQSILAGKYKIGMSVPSHLMLEFELLPHTITLLAHRQWLLLSGPKTETGFVTTDNPVTLSWFDQEGKQYPPGLGLRNTQVVFPISNDCAVIGTFEYDGRSVEADDDWVAKSNGNTILLRNRQVYARDGTFQYQMRHHGQRQFGHQMLNDEQVLAQRPRDSN